MSVWISIDWDGHPDFSGVRQEPNSDERTLDPKELLGMTIVDFRYDAGGKLEWEMQSPILP